MPTPQQLSALKQIATASVISERATACPAELSAAQAILESGWLSHCPGNNCFGIKPDDHGSGVQYRISKEFENGEWEQPKEAFETYATLSDCFIDHARLITSGEAYKDPWEQYGQDHDLDSLITGVARRYATDPNYARSILALANDPIVSAAIVTARNNLCSGGL